LTDVLKCENGWGNEQFEVETILDYQVSEVLLCNVFLINYFNILLMFLILNLTYLFCNNSNQLLQHIINVFDTKFDLFILQQIVTKAKT